MIRSLIVLVCLLILPVSSASAYYDPGLGQWLERDPLIKPEFGAQLNVNPGAAEWVINEYVPEVTSEAVMFAIPAIYADQANLYRSHWNNPVTTVDPYGLTPGFNPTDPGEFGRKPGQTLRPSMNWKKFLKARAKGFGFLTLLQVGGCAAAILEMDIACRIYSETDDIWVGCFCQQLTTPPGPARFLCNLASKKMVTGIDPIEMARKAAGCDQLQGTIYEPVCDDP